MGCNGGEGAGGYRVEGDEGGIEGEGYRLKNVCPSRRPRSRPVRHTKVSGVGFVTFFMHGMVLIICGIERRTIVFGGVWIFVGKIFFFNYSDFFGGYFWIYSVPFC